MTAFTGVRRRGHAGRSSGAAVAPPNGDALSRSRPDLFVSFGVIFVTLVGLGLGLPPVVRWLGVARDGRDEYVAEHEQEIAARREALAEALKSLDAITDDRELSDEVVKLLRSRHEIRSNQLPDTLDPDKHDASAAGTALTRELIGAERNSSTRCCAKARSPTRRGAGSSATSTWRRRVRESGVSKDSVVIDEILSPRRPGEGRDP